MPRRGAPHAPHGRGYEETAERVSPATAKTESSFSTRRLPHFLQLAGAAAELRIFSNFVPQARHRYSKMGTGTRFPLQYIPAPAGFQCPGKRPRLDGDA